MNRYLLVFFIAALSIAWSFYGKQADPEHLDVEAQLSKALYNYVTQIKHLNKTHPNFVVMFSATPGMGKTEISKKLETHFKALNIRNDRIRRVIRNQGLNPENHDKGERILDIFIHKYLFPWLKSQSNNGFIILDSSVDRKFHEVKAILKREQIPYCLIRLDCPIDTAKERIKERHPSIYLEYEPHFPRWKKDYLELDPSCFDFTFDSSGELSERELQPLYRFIERRLNRLKR